VLIDATARAAVALAQPTSVRAARTVQRRIDRLTPRVREVMALVATGRMNKFVADELGAAEKTVEIHRGRVMEKMKAASLAELVRMLVASGLDTPELRP